VTGLSINARQTASGYEIFFKGSRYNVSYPDEIWQDYPKEAREVLFDNLVYSETLHLPLTHRKNEINYCTSPPYFQTQFFQNFIMDLPSCADVDDTSTSELIREFMNLRFRFKDNEIKFPTYRELTREDSSVVSFKLWKGQLTDLGCLS
jgi:hypothetical protein